MRVNYQGSTNFDDTRFAVITYKESEMDALEKIIDILDSYGYVSNVVEDCVWCQVDDRQEYETFVQDYKEAKKAIKK